MLDSILSYGRLALLGIAMAFLINPYNAHGIPDDADGDYIHDLEDVCLNESYLMTYHEECLSDAGVYFVHADLDLAEVLKLLLDALPVIPPGVRKFIRDGLDRFGHHLYFDSIDTFEEAQIETCYDLEGFAGWYYDIADKHDERADFLIEVVELLEPFATRLPHIVLPIVIPFIRIAVILRNQAAFVRKAALAAQTAHANLCLFRWANPTPVD